MNTLTSFPSSPRRQGFPQRLATVSVAEGLGLRPQTFVKCACEKDPDFAWELGGRVVDARDLGPCHLRNASPTCLFSRLLSCPCMPGTAHPVRMRPSTPQILRGGPHPFYRGGPEIGSGLLSECSGWYWSSVVCRLPVGCHVPWETPSGLLWLK